MIRAAALTLALLTTPAGAAILPVWTMGANPCAGTCSPSWAAAAIGEELGPAWTDRIAAVMLAPGLLRTIPAGSTIYAMSEGGPRMRFHKMVVPEDTAATVWPLDDGFVWAHFNGPGQCANWAIVYVGKRDTGPGGGAAFRGWLSHPGGVWHLYGGGPYLGVGYWEAGGRTELILSDARMEGNTPPAPPRADAPPLASTTIPLPASLWLGLATVGMFWLTRRRTR